LKTEKITSLSPGRRTFHVEDFKRTFHVEDKLSLKNSKIYTSTVEYKN